AQSRTIRSAHVLPGFSSRNPWQEAEGCTPSNDSNKHSPPSVSLATKYAWSGSKMAAASANTKGGAGCLSILPKLPPSSSSRRVPYCARPRSNRAEGNQGWAWMRRCEPRERFRFRLGLRVLVKSVRLDVLLDGAWRAVTNALAGRQARSQFLAAVTDQRHLDGGMLDFQKTLLANERAQCVPVGIGRSGATHHHRRCQRTDPIRLAPGWEIDERIGAHQQE